MSPMHNVRGEAWMITAVDEVQSEATVTSRDAGAPPAVHGWHTRTAHPPLVV